MARRSRCSSTRETITTDELFGGAPERVRLCRGNSNYAVTVDGDVWSRGGRSGTTGAPGRWARAQTGPAGRGGYWWVQFHANGHQRRHSVHSLVLNAFAGAKSGNQQCRHLDGNPANNRLDNLQWGSPAENGEDRVRHGTAARGSRNGRAKLSEDDVVEIVRRVTAGATYPVVADAFGVKRAQISKIMCGRAWTDLETVDFKVYLDEADSGVRIKQARPTFTVFERLPAKRWSSADPVDLDGTDPIRRVVYDIAGYSDGAAFYSRRAT